MVSIIIMAHSSKDHIGNKLYVISKLRSPVQSCFLLVCSHSISCTLLPQHLVNAILTAGICVQFPYKNMCSLKAEALSQPIERAESQSFDRLRLVLFPTLHHLPQAKTLVTGSLTIWDDNIHPTVLVLIAHIYTETTWPTDKWGPIEVTWGK